MSDFFQPIVGSTTQNGVVVPPIIYGTAQKSDPAMIVSALVSEATALDSACQPKYYDEEVVGQGLQVAFQAKKDGGLGISRENIYIQSKFTTPSGHSSSTLPYLASDSLPTMVEKSIRLTLKRLQVQYLDTLLLHAPMSRMEETLEVWKAMESLVGKETRVIGICNVDILVLQELYDTAVVKPSIVQNRFGLIMDMIKTCGHIVKITELFIKPFGLYQQIIDFFVLA